MVFQQLGGINVVMFYASEIFKDAGKLELAFSNDLLHFVILYFRCLIDLDCYVGFDSSHVASVSVAALQVIIFHVQ